MSHVLKRRYGRHAGRRVPIKGRRRKGHSYMSDSGVRKIDDMVRAERASTMRVPRLSMREQIEHDKQLSGTKARLREVREAERARG
jgi:hypothetical protein